MQKRDQEKMNVIKTYNVSLNMVIFSIFIKLFLLAGVEFFQLVDTL